MTGCMDKKVASNLVDYEETYLVLNIFLSELFQCFNSHCEAYCQVKALPVMFQKFPWRSVDEKSQDLLISKNWCICSL